jgi:hypothetical protein
MSANVTVNLVDRVITDAGMTLGSRGLTSTQGVHVQSDTSPVNGISVRDNDIIKDAGKWATGILISGNETHYVSVVENSMRGATDNGSDSR